MNNLAFVYSMQGRHAEVEPLLGEVLEGARKTLGPTHLNTLGVAGELAAQLGKQGRHGEAEAMLRGALEGAQAALGPAHPTTLMLQLIPPSVGVDLKVSSGALG